MCIHILHYNVICVPAPWPTLQLCDMATIGTNSGAVVPLQPSSSRVISLVVIRLCCDDDKAESFLFPPPFSCPASSSDAVVE